MGYCNDIFIGGCVPTSEKDFKNYTGVDGCQNLFCSKKNFRCLDCMPGYQKVNAEGFSIADGNFVELCRKCEVEGCAECNKDVKRCERCDVSRGYFMEYSGLCAENSRR